MNTTTRQSKFSYLARTNYDNWSIQLEALLRSEDLWEIVNTGYLKPVPTPTEDEALNLLKKNRKKDEKALYYLYQAVNESAFEKITGAKM